MYILCRASFQCMEQSCQIVPAPCNSTAYSKLPATYSTREFTSCITKWKLHFYLLLPTTGTSSYSISLWQGWCYGSLEKIILPKAPSLTLESIDVHVSFSGFYWKVALQNLLFFLGSAQMSNLWDNLWKIIKIIFFRKWLSTGSLDTHLAQSLILPSLVQTSIHFLTVKELCIIVCQLDVCITWCVFLFFPDRKLRKV